MNNRPLCRKDPCVRGILLFEVLCWLTVRRDSKPTPLSMLTTCSCECWVLLFYCAEINGTRDGYSFLLSLSNVMLESKVLVLDSTYSQFPRCSAAQHAPMSAVVMLIDKKRGLARLLLLVVLSPSPLLRHRLFCVWSFTYQWRKRELSPPFVHPPPLIPRHGLCAVTAATRLPSPILPRSKRKETQFQTQTNETFNI